MSVTTKKAPQSRPTRFSSFLPAILHEVGDYPCRATEISRSGVLLFGDLPVPSVNKCRVTLGSPAGDLALKSAARIVRVVGGEVPGEVVIALEFAALDARRSEILEKLLARVKESRIPGPLDRLEPGATEQQRRAAVHDVAKSQKIALAQRAQPQERAQLFLDDDLHVMEGLARNPRLSKRELKALAERRKLLPTTVAILAAHPRAVGDEGLQVQLASHPQAPLDVAQKIAAGLSAEGVRRLIRAPTLGDALRSHLLRQYPEAASKSW